MAIVTFSRKQFERDIGKLDKEMQNKIAMFGTTLEKFDDESIEIEVFPNRPDLLSYQGFKRAFLAFIGKKTGIKSYKVNKPQKDYKVIIDSSVKKVRPYTVCSIVKGLKLSDEKIKEIIEIQEKLHFTLGRKRKKLAIGIYPLDKIKLPIKYKAIEPDKIKFVPLDSDREMSGLQILQRHPTGREYAHLLAGKPKFPIFIDSNKNILSMPPIINSQLTGKVTTSTRDVFVECSGFDPEILEKCLNIIVTSLAEIGGNIYQMKIIDKKTKITPNLNPEKMKISIKNTNKLLGLNLSEKELKKLLEKMGYSYKKGVVEIPAWRTDILHEVDLIEDIAIAYGYENFVPEIPNIATIGEEDFKERVKRKIAEILAGLEMLEVANYHLTTIQNQFLKMGVPEKQALSDKETIKIEESKTEYNILRKDLSHYLLKVFSENVDAQYPQRIFETGKIFKLKEGKVVESESLAAALAPGSFTELKQILEYLFRMLFGDGKKLEYSDDFNASEYRHFIDGRAAKLIFDGEVIGYIGEIHPRILKNWKIKMPVALFEICLDRIFERLKN